MSVASSSDIDPQAEPNVTLLLRMAWKTRIVLKSVGA
jgi:hypothetical protein